MDIKKLITKPSTWALALGGASTYMLYRFFTMENVSSSEGGAISFKAPPPQAAKVEAVKKPRFIRPDGVAYNVLVLYGTEYGLSHEVAQKLESEINAISGGLFWARVVDMEEFEIVDFAREQLVLVITSTYGDGVPPTTARPFFDSLETTPVDFAHLKFAVLALGDRSYPLYCAAGKAMDRLFAANGAVRLIDRVEADQEDWNVFDRWIGSVASTVSALSLETRADDYLAERALTFASAQGKHNKKTPYPARLVARRLLTDGDKEAYHFEFELGDSELKWLPGDALGVLAHNTPSEVASILSLLKLSATLKVSTPTWHYQEKSTSNPSMSTLDHILTVCYDLHNLKPELITLLRDNAKSVDEKSRLSALLAQGTSKSNELLHKFLEGHHLVDVLKMFQSARPTINDLLSNLAKLLPRYYSIASSFDHNEKTVSLCVAIVRYDMHSSGRIGVASTHIADRLAIGDRVSIYVNNNPDFRLPEDKSLPIIMIGPGTGLAPFIAFVQQRIKDQASGANHLYFGCRTEKEDFLYRDELRAYESLGQITLSTAFSRATSQKVYVQNRLAENGQQIAALIESGAHIYVCGDAKNMAPDVHNTLKSIIVQHLSVDVADAELYLHQLEKQKRYQKDTWF
eukprot:gene16352-19452_t